MLISGVQEVGWRVQIDVQCTIMHTTFSTASHFDSGRLCRRTELYVYELCLWETITYFSECSLKVDQIGRF